MKPDCKYTNTFRNLSVVEEYSDGPAGMTMKYPRVVTHIKELHRNGSQHYASFIQKCLAVKKKLYLH